MTIVERRSRDMGGAIVSSRLEGVEPTEDFLQAADGYVSEKLTLRQMLEAGDQRWPLARG